MGCAAKSALVGPVCRLVEALVGRDQMANSVPGRPVAEGASGRTLDSPMPESLRSCLAVEASGES
jgi:hypothetical protein